MVMQEEHIIDVALNGKNYCLSSIHKQQHYFVAGTSVRMHGARMYTPQMIAGSTRKEGTYHFFEIKVTALSLMVPNVGLTWKWKKDTVNTFKVSTTGGLNTFTTEIFGIPLMKHSWYALKHCLVDVKEDKRACYHTKEAAIFAACIRGILEYPYKCSKTSNRVPTWANH
jgi:succinate dehydrogenase hydrophobic anchor subunit